MLRRAFLAIAALCLAALPAGAADDPAAHVRAMYEVQLKGEQTKSYVWDKPHIDRFFTLSLARRITATRLGDGIDFDFLFDGQDYDIKDLSVVPVRSGASRATVEARFVNFDQRKRVTFHMVREAGAWRVADISTQGQHGWVLSKLLTNR